MTVIVGPIFIRLVTFVPPPFLLILAFQPILFHTVVTKEEFFKKSRAGLFECGVANDMSKGTHVGVHHVDTMFLFCSVQFALDHLKINFAWLRFRVVNRGEEKVRVHMNVVSRSTVNKNDRPRLSLSNLRAQSAE